MIVEFPRKGVQEISHRRMSQHTHVHLCLIVAVVCLLSLPIHGMVADKEGLFAVVGDFHHAEKRVLGYRTKCVPTPRKACRHFTAGIKRMYFCFYVMGKHCTALDK